MNEEYIKSIIVDITNDEIINKLINKFSFLLFLSDEKEITLEYINLKYYKKVKSFFSKYSNDFSFKIWKYDKNEFIIYFWKKENSVSFFKEKFEAYINDKNKSTIYIWQMLWFPDCCINKFDNHFTKHDFNMIPDLTYSYVEKIISDSDKNDIELDIFGDRIITHTPCSFSCKPSIDLYNKSINIFKRYWLDIDYLKEETQKEYLIFKSNDYIWKVDNNIKYMWKYYSKNSYSDFYFNSIIKKINSWEEFFSNNIKDTIYIKFSK